jgi:hypothetical protein
MKVEAQAKSIDTYLCYKDFEGPSDEQLRIAYQKRSKVHRAKSFTGCGQGSVQTRSVGTPRDLKHCSFVGGIRIK